MIGVAAGPQTEAISLFLKNSHLSLSGSGEGRDTTKTTVGLLNCGVLMVRGKSNLFPPMLLRTSLPVADLIHSSLRVLDITPFYGSFTTKNFLGRVALNGGWI